MNREQKAVVIDEIAAQISESEAIFAVDYRGTSVVEAAELREKLRDADATLRVVKNSLTELAADKAGAETLKRLLEGPTAFTFVRGDAAVAAKALADFARGRDTLAFKGGLLGASELSAEDIAALSKLPARDILYGQLVGVVASPITGLVRGLNQLIAGLAIALQQVVDEGKLPAGPEGGAAQAEANGGEPAEPEAEPVAEPEAEGDTQVAAEAEPVAEQEAEVASAPDEPQPDQA
ncbi:MAG TPA: 50S ribosomal protein L10, partial [Solirubrobacteraceae bacterium]|nr:50S ribosomal protein L10 [Solirubrobacteraceae bacterium]